MLEDLYNEMLPFKRGTLGGWVSKNHITWACISKWLYRQLDGFVDDEPYVPPNKPVKRWLVKDCQVG